MYIGYGISSIPKIPARVRIFLARQDSGTGATPRIRLRGTDDSPSVEKRREIGNSAGFPRAGLPGKPAGKIILDDAGELQNDACGGWQIISIPRRFRSLPEKFNAIAGLAKGDILVVWEDDDIWLPHHISTHVRAMEGRLWSKPSFVLSSYTGRLEQEDATGRFHASLAFRREIFDRIVAGL